MNSQTFSNFQEGIYLVWEVNGRVTMRMTKVSGLNAVLSGIFFGNRLLPSRLTAASMANGQFHLRLEGEIGGRFEIQATPDFQSWTGLGTNTFLSNIFDFYISPGGLPRNFYRSRLVP